MIKSFNLKTTKLIFPKFHIYINNINMPNKKVCKQYPQDQYGPKAPDISGKWEEYISRMHIDESTKKIITENIKVTNTIFNQNNLYFNYIHTYFIKSEMVTEKVIGMLYPVGKCWEAKTVDEFDNGTKTYQITEIKCGKVTKMQSTYTEAGFQPENPTQRPTVCVFNWYRID